ncbi:MAG: hypothetical protein AB7T63_06800 [Planctomycetota bacterium]
MSATVHIVLGVLFLAAGAYATWTMLELFGGQAGAEGKDRATVRHRWAGRVFGILYVILLASMLSKVRGAGGLGATQALHAMLGLSIAPLLLVKLVIARRHKSLHRILPGFGITLFLLAFATVATGALPRWQRSGTSEAWESVAEGDLASVGARLSQSRCTACHDLGRVEAQKGRLDAAGWAQVFERMAKRDPSLREVRGPILAWLERDFAAAAGTVPAGGGTGGGDDDGGTDDDGRGRGRGRGRGGDDR